MIIEKLKKAEIKMPTIMHAATNQTCNKKLPPLDHVSRYRRCQMLQPFGQHFGDLFHVVLRSTKHKTVATLRGSVVEENR